MKYLLILMFIFIGCEETNPQQKQVVEIIYKKDLQITFAGKLYDGIAVLPYQSQYQLGIKAYNKISLLQSVSCHRDTPPYYGDSNSVNLIYTPVIGIEDTGKFPLILSAYATKDIFSLGVMLFQNPKYTSKAIYNCCGYTYTRIGTGECQCKQGLRQRLTFDCATRFEETVRPGCPLLTTIDFKSFDYNIGSGQCEYMLKETCAGQERKHILYTFGYDEVIIHK